MDKKDKNKTNKFRDEFGDGFQEELLNYVKSLNIQNPDELIHPIENEFGIKMKKYSIRGGLNPEIDTGIDLWNLNYCQLNSPRFHDFVDKFRGVVIDKDFRIVCRAFDRFYNYEEYVKSDPGYITDFGEDNQIIEKLDGSLIKLYYLEGHGWVFGTRGVPEAAQCEVDGSIIRNGRKLSFQDLIDRALTKYCTSNIEELLHDVKLIPDYREYTFLFELCTKENRVVTPYNEDKIVLLGARHPNGEHLTREELALTKFDLPELTPFKSWEDVVKMTKELPDLLEGFIILNNKDKRIKIKSPTYVHAHHLRTNGVMTIQKAYQTYSEREEILGYFPELKEFYDAVTNGFKKFESRAFEVFEIVNEEVFGKKLANSNQDSSQEFNYFEYYKQNKLSREDRSKLARRVKELSKSGENSSIIHAIYLMLDSKTPEEIWEKMFDSHKIEFIESVMVSVTELNTN